MLATGSMPVRVTAMPIYCEPDVPNAATASMVADKAAVITCLNDDKSVFKVFGHATFGGHENSYRICATKGQIENVRGSGGKVMLRYNDWEKPEGVPAESYYQPELHDKDKETIERSGHGGGDFFVIREFFSCIRENRRPEFDVYFGTTMASVAILAHRSIMNGGMPYDIPDFRKEEDRVRYENDNETPFFGSDGSKPTFQPCSHPEFAPTDEQLQSYADWLYDGENK